MKGDHLDPKALIREAYRIDGIVIEECRAIFFDWALSVPMDQDAQAMIAKVLEHYKNQPEDHPMTAVLREGLQAAPHTGRSRRGGRAARLRD